MSFIDLLNKPLPSAAKSDDIVTEEADVLDDAQNLADGITDDIGEDDVESLMDDVTTDDNDDDDDDEDDDEPDEEFDEDDLDPEAVAAFNMPIEDDDDEEVTLDDKSSADADTYMAAVATPVILDQELNSDEKKDFLESIELDMAINEGFLTESDAYELSDDLGMVDDDIYTEAKIATKNKVQFTLKAWYARLFEIAVLASARAANDPDFKRLQKVYKLKRKYRDKLRVKYKSEAVKRTKIYLKRLKTSRSKTLNNIGKKMDKASK